MIKNRVINRVLALCVAASLLLAQYAGLHFHVQHDVAVSGHAHILDAHSGHDGHVHAVAASTLDGLSGTHEAAIDISQQSLLKYSTALFAIALLVLFGWRLFAPGWQYRCRWYRSTTISELFTCLLRPPLRAPPVL